jgi:hypothetical protein
VNGVERRVGLCVSVSLARYSERVVHPHFLRASARQEIQDVTLELHHFRIALPDGENNTTPRSVIQNSECHVLRRPFSARTSPAEEDEWR